MKPDRSSSDQDWLTFSRPPSRRLFFAVVTGLALGFWLLSLITGLADALLGHPAGVLAAPFFSVDEEGSFYTWLSSSVLLLTGLYSLMLAGERFATGERFRWYWLGLGVGFLALSAEEIAGLHEYMAEHSDHLFRLLLPTWKDPTFGWPVIALTLCIPVGLAYLPFVIALPGPIRRDVIVAGAIFLLSAGGVELLAGDLLGDFDFYTWPYVLISHAEEGLELAGVILFFRAITKLRAARPS